MHFLFVSVCMWMNSFLYTSLRQNEWTIFLLILRVVILCWSKNGICKITQNTEELPSFPIYIHIVYHTKSIYQWRFIFATNNVSIPFYIFLILILFLNNGTGSVYFLIVKRNICNKIYHLKFQTINYSSSQITQKI